MQEFIELRQENLARIADKITCPAYDRSKLRAGIVHIGVGGFHRSHEAVYTHALMNETEASNWGICGVGLREDDRKMRDILLAQDYLYTLIVKHPQVNEQALIESFVIGSLVDFLLGCDDAGAVIDRMASADTRIVSLTITEGGYNVKPATGEFDFDNLEVQHDLQNPAKPKTVFGYLTAALKKRRAAGLPAFTIQSCDNIQHNGDMARSMLLAFAYQQDAELAHWIENEVCFPNAMVDRITPVTTAQDIAWLTKATGVKDAWPVTCEPFTQWVIEDRFSNGRPAWEKVGAQFVADVTPYEKMKIRLLNAGHSVLGLLGSIHGHDTIDGCVADPLFAAYLRRFMDIEATPVLDPVEGVDLEAYKVSLIERFANPNIKDSLARICLQSSAKLPKFLISTIHENLARGGSIKYATLVIAAWCLYSDKGRNRHGMELDIVDEMKDALHQAAMKTENDPLAFIRLKSIFGDLASNEKFTGLYTEMVQALYKDADIKQQMQKILSSAD